MYGLMFKYEAKRLLSKKLPYIEINESKMVGGTGAFKILKQKLDKLMNSNGRILISGPSGSGKEIAARYIHANSHRSGEPFVSVSCASIEPNKMEEVLFGTEVGGVIKSGFLEKASGGILFFDEVADMPMSTQTRLLRILQDEDNLEKENKDGQNSNVRIITSTQQTI